jgi:hypothetical protein
MSKNKKMSAGNKVAMGAGIAALGAGAYYLLGPDAKTHQKKAKILMGKMEKEVKKEMKKAKVAGTPLYYRAVDIISSNYAKQYKAHEQEIKFFAEKLKKEWKGPSKKTAKKPTKKTRKTRA